MKSKRRSLRTMLTLALTVCMLAGNVSTAPSVAYAAAGDTAEAHQHVFGDYTYNNDATCEADGTETADCVVEGCSATNTRDKKGTALGHEYLDKDFKWIWATEHDSATLIMTCSHDSSHMREIETRDIAIKEIKAPTCTQKGIADYTATAIIEEAPVAEEPAAQEEAPAAEPAPVRTASDTVSVYTAPAGHDYQAASWEWASDFSDASVNLVCSRDKSHTDSMVADVTFEDPKAPTCTESGQRIYTASVVLKGETIRSNPRTVTLQPLGHDYEAASWSWSANYAQASAELVCKNDKSHTLSRTATVTSKELSVSCETDGSTVYTATITLDDGKKIVDEKKIIHKKATGHDYMRNGFIWAEDMNSADLLIVCRNDSTHRYTIPADVSISTTATCTQRGKNYYTARAEFNGEVVTANNTRDVDALGHDYADPIFNWKGVDACQASIRCKRCGETAIADCSIISQMIPESEADHIHAKTIYTATAVLLGKSYSEDKTIVDATHRPLPTVREEVEPQGYDDVITCSICQEEISRKHVTFTIKFETAKGSGSMDDLTVEYGVPTNIPANTFTCTGNHTNGWYAQRADDSVYAELKGTPGWYTVDQLNAAGQDGYVFRAESDICRITDVADDEVTMFPKWIPNVTTVKFNKHGGTGTMKDMTVNYGNSTALTKNTFTRTGYTFTGWYAYRKSDKKYYAKNSAGTKSWYTADKIEANGYTKVLYKDAAKVSKLSKIDGDTVTMYAQWKLNTYNIAFNKNGATSGTMNTVKKVRYNETRALPANNFKRSGYKFSGWLATRSYDGKWFAKNTNTGKNGWYTKSQIEKKKYSYIVFKDMSNVKSLTDIAGDTIIMYAQWRR